jgi:outer membrane protein OmpA-like peptidoglycan-associated protein
MYDKRLIALLFFVLPLSLFSQQYTTRSTAPKKLQKLFEQALYFNQIRDFAAAERELIAVVEADPTFIDAFIMLGNIRYNQQDMAAAEKAYKQALDLDPIYQHRLWYQTGLTQLRQGKYDIAIASFNQYLSIDDNNPGLKKRAAQHLANAVFALEAIQQPVPFDPKPLNAAVNTRNAEYCPIISVDGKSLIFNRVVNGQEDFYISRMENEVWQAATPIEELNSPYNEGASSFSADGQYMVFTACNRPEGLGQCDLFFAFRQNGQWETPRNLGTPVNSRHWDSQPSLSSDGRVLVFASDRPGGQGGRDLWWTQKTDAGTWADPVNLGENINTSGDEQSPFFHADGKTLYFMSDGWPGMGGFDLFVARLQSDGTWSKPANLGYPINTFANEGALTVSLDGTKAWFDSDFRSPESGIPIDPRLKGNADIFSFELYPEARPVPVTYLKAQVSDARDQSPLQANAGLIRLSDQQLVSSSLTSETGTLLLCIPAGHPYALNISRPGYAFHSENFELTDVRSALDPFLLNIALQPLTAAKNDVEQSDPVILKNIFFETGSASLLPASLPELQKLLGLMRENPSLSIQIQGHTDNVGTTADNQQLSEDRARAVYEYLSSQGIAPERLTYIGFGETQPIAPNDTEAGRKDNRRTAFVVFYPK